MSTTHKSNIVKGTVVGKGITVACKATVGKTVGCPLPYNKFDFYDSYCNSQHMAVLANKLNIVIITDLTIKGAIKNIRNLRNEINGIIHDITISNFNNRDTDLSNYELAIIVDIPAHGHILPECYVVLQLATNSISYNIAGMIGNINGAIDIFSTVMQCINLTNAHKEEAIRKTNARNLLLIQITDNEKHSKISVTDWLESKKLS